MNEFIRRIQGKKVICFGAGYALIALCRDYHEHGMETYIHYIVDNNRDLWGSEKIIHDTAIPVHSPQKLCADAGRDTVILVPSKDYFVEIIKQLNTVPKLDVAECYAAYFIAEAEQRNNASLIPAGFRANPHPAIPKIIHYFWFGDNPLPDRHKEYISGWKNHCPDYEIIEWNERNYDVNKHQYTKDASMAGRWSKVATYARFDVVHDYGGICMDTDVELMRSLDELLYNDAFIGFGDICRINSGSGFGAVKNFRLLREMRDNYNGTLLNDDGSPNLEFNGLFETDFLVKHGLKADGSFQIIDKLTVYPADCFSPKPWYVPNQNGGLYATKNTFAVHHYDTTLAGKGHVAIKDTMGKLYEAAMKNEKRFCS